MPFPRLKIKELSIRKASAQFGIPYGTLGIKCEAEDLITGKQKVNSVFKKNCILIEDINIANLMKFRIGRLYFYI